MQFYAFDCLALDGDDLRSLPLSMRKTNLARLLARRPDGIFVAPFEQGEIGPDLFRAACRLGLEGLVSKRRDRPYQAGRSKHWNQCEEPPLPGDEPGDGGVRVNLRLETVTGPRRVAHSAFVGDLSPEFALPTSR